MIKWINRTDEKPLEDWQRDTLSQNINCFYEAMKKHKMEHHSDGDIGRDVLTYVTRAMRNYDPKRSKISTFIYKYVDFGLREARRKFKKELEEKTYAVSSFGVFNDQDIQLIDPATVEGKEPYLIEELTHALRLLPAQYRIALKLYCSGDHTCQSGGEAMGLSRQRYDQLVHKGLEKLRELLPRKEWLWD